MKYVLPAIAYAALFAGSVQAQLFNFTTFAGSAARGNVDGVTNLSQFNAPGGVAMDTSGNIYIADTGDNTIRKIAPNGTVNTFAGSPGVSGSTDGTGTNALFNAPQGIAVDGSGNVYVADTGNDTIRRITSAGAVNTLAGLAGNAGSANGLGTNAAFYEPEGIAVDTLSNVFVADTWNHMIREVNATGMVTTVAGSAGNFGSTNATGTNALFYEPGAVAVDGSDDVFVADTGNNVIREIAAGGMVTTLAGSAGNFGYTNATGTNALFNAPQGISIDSSGNLYVADYLNNAIREVTPAGVVTTLAGSPGNFGSANGIGTNALFFEPQCIAVNPTNSSFIYVADTGNSTVRQLMYSSPNWIVSTFAGDASIGSMDSTGNAARFFWPMDVASDGQGNFYVADANNNTIRKITSGGTVSTFAGFPGVTGSANGNGTNASFNDPQAVAVDGSGNVYVADTGNSVIREITSGGAVSTLAGTAGITGSFDGTGGNAQFDEPEGIAVNGSGDVFVADTLNHTIREIAPGGVVTTFAGVAGNFGSADGTNSAAQFNHPTGLTVDNNGNLFVADTLNHTIREVTPGGVVSTLAGLARVFGSTDGANNTARFFEPEGIAVDGSENVYVADAGNYSIRQLTPSGTNWIVTTIAGWPGVSGNADGSGIGARFDYPAGVTMSAGTLTVADSGNDTIRSGSIITDNPPMILSQPQSQAVLFGTPVTFSVGATGVSTLYYQWLFNGVNIAGATSASYTLSNPQLGNGGIYSVEVLSPTGTTLSSNATLVVYAPPVITNQPVSQVCLQGATVSFSVVAGPQPLTYQWEENGHPLSNGPGIGGANTATLTLTNVTTASSASYSVLISNGYGSISSSSATLQVYFVPPPDSVQPTAWWQLNEGTGTTAYDYSGNGHNGTLNSGVSWTPSGYSGNGAYFNATEFSLITIASPFTISANWTVTMWVNRWESKSGSVLISGSTYALKLEQAGATNRVGYTHYGVQDYALGYTTPVNSWVHLAFVETSAGVSVYANGVLMANNITNSAVQATALGVDQYTVYKTDYLDATLDDVRIYNQALTAQQITNIYAYGRISPIPAITLASPTNGASFIVSSNITLSANVVSNAQTLTSVQFFAGTNLLGQTTAVPYTWTWTNAPAGNYSLTASALFNGTNTASPAVGIYVAISTNQPALSFSKTNGTLQLSWPPDHTGWMLEAQTNSNTVGLSTNWAMIGSSTATNTMGVPVVPTNGTVFYRLIYP